MEGRLEVHFSFRFLGSLVLHHGTIKMEKDKSYTFSKASQEVNSYLSKKYGWSAEEIVEINMKLMAGVISETTRHNS